MGIAAAGDDACQWKVATCMDGHGSTLGKAEQNCVFQRCLTALKSKEALLKLAYCCRY